MRRKKKKKKGKKRKRRKKISNKLYIITKYLKLFKTKIILLIKILYKT